MMHVTDIFFIAVAAAFSFIFTVLLCITLIRTHEQRYENECELTDTTESLARARKILDKVADVAGADINTAKLKEQA